MRRLWALMLILAACTAEAPAPEGEGAGSPGTVEGSPSTPIRIPIVASEGDLDRSFLDGMSLAQAKVNRDGGIDGHPLETSLEVGGVAETPDRLRSVLQLSPPAVFVVGPAEAAATVRPEIEASRTPVVLLGGDAYTGRQLHRYLFQTSVPFQWQARVLATYLHEDRGLDQVTLLTEGPAESLTRSFTEAFAEEGAPAPRQLALGSGQGSPGTVRAAAGADAVIVATGPERVGRVARLLEQLEPRPQVVLPPSALGLVSEASLGTVVTYPYTWAGWADMLPRVDVFRDSFVSRFDELPSGLEQEGYDAVMAVAEALERTGGRGGEALVRELETFREETYSSVPVRLGPDDHVFAEQSHLGLFAVSDPAEASAGEAFGAVPWRPVLRTFTTDGEKVNFLNRDKQIFFEFWHSKRPTPKYWKSEYGILDRRGEGPA